MQFMGPSSLRVKLPAFKCSCICFCNCLLHKHTHKFSHQQRSSLAWKKKHTHNKIDYIFLIFSLRHIINMTEKQQLNPKPSCCCSFLGGFVSFEVVTKRNILVVVVRFFGSKNKYNCAESSLIKEVNPFLKHFLPFVFVLFRFFFKWSY